MLSISRARVIGKVGSAEASSRCAGGNGLRTIRIGSGAGYSGDRIEPAVELAEKGNIQYLVFECLASAPLRWRSRRG